MPSNRSGFTASARWSKPTDFSEHTSLPTEFARFSTVLTTNISLFHRRSPDHALGDLAPKTTIGKILTVIYIFADLSIIIGFIETVAKETLDRRMSGRSSKEDQEGGEVGGS